jgi:hypothetical protein
VRIADTILTGKDGIYVCGRCGTRTLSISIHDVQLPDGIKPQSTILYSGDDEKPFHKHLGIGCGCYAKFHRQIAHIADRMERK